VNDEAWEYATDLLNTVDAALLARVLYQYFANYWPVVALSPSSSMYEKDFAH
jgi:hypothetical protein